MQHVNKFSVRCLNFLVVADDRAVLGHQCTQFAPEQKRILAAIGTHQAGIDFLLPFTLCLKMTVAGGVLQILRVLHCVRAGDEASKDARHQRVRAEPIRAVILIFGFSCGEDAGDVRRLFVIHPEAAHGVVHAGEDLHRCVARIVADELLVNFEDAFQLAVESLAIDMRQVKIDHRLAVDSQVVLVHYFENRARRNVARNEVAVFRVPLFEEVPALTLRNGFGVALVALSFWNPDASALAACRFRHQAQLVFPGDRRGMNLNELAVRVVTALLIERGLCRSGAHNRVGGLAEDGANAAGCDDDGIGREGAHFHRSQIHRADAAANAVRVEHGRKKLPVLVLLYLAFGFVTADLLVESIEKLLAGGCSGERGAIIERASKAAKIEQTFGRAIEWNAHAVEKIDNAGSSVAHGFDRRLVGEEVASVDRVVEMLPGGIAFAFQVLGGVDASLRANRVRTLYGDDGKQINLAAHLGDLDNGGEACQTTAHYDDFRSYCHAAMSPICRARTPGSPRTISRYRITMFPEGAVGSKRSGGVLRNPYTLTAPIETRPSASARHT